MNQEFRESAAPLRPPQYIRHDTNNGVIYSQNIIISLHENTENPDETEAANDAFIQRALRHCFIIKVYSILLIQLVITGLVIIGYFKMPVFVRHFIEDNFWKFFIAPWIIVCFTFFCILCYEGPRRRVPWNYLFLLVFTISFSFIVGLITRPFLIRYDEILITAGITFTIVLALTLLAFQTKFDFTLLAGSGLCLLIAILMLGILMLATSYDQMVLVYLTIGVFIVSVYIVWDTEMIVGGHHRYEFSTGEYVFAAFLLYIDIIYLFYWILKQAVRYYI